eukprot:480145-Prymnesium_polylepis.1
MLKRACMRDAAAGGSRGTGADAAWASVYGRDRLLPRDAVVHSTTLPVVVYPVPSSELKTTTGHVALWGGRGFDEPWLRHAPNLGAVPSQRAFSHLKCGFPRHRTDGRTGRRATWTAHGDYLS